VSADYDLASGSRGYPEWYERIEAKFNAYNAPLYGKSEITWTGARVLAVVHSIEGYFCCPTPLLLPIDPRGWLTKPAGSAAALKIAVALDKDWSSASPSRTGELMGRVAHSIAMEWQDWALPLLHYLHVPDGPESLTLEQAHAICYAFAFAYIARPIERANIANKIASQTEVFIEVAESLVRLGAAPSYLFVEAVAYLNKVQSFWVPYPGAVGWVCTPGQPPYADRDWPSVTRLMGKYVQLDRAPALNLKLGVEVRQFGALSPNW
jgi:hypothetical protein